MLFDKVLAARSLLKSHIHHTPLFHSRMLSELLGCELYIKAEFLQKTGSFKARGALHFLLQHYLGTPSFTTFSSGNHGQAVAWAAQQLARKAEIFMPEDASPVKVAAVKAYGAGVHFAGLSSEDRRIACEAYAQAQDLEIVPPYDHEDIIAGQGTGMLEVLEDLPNFDCALLPVGGGGLLSGNALVLGVLRPQTKVYACEPELAADAKMSLEKDELVTIPYPKTIADGVRSLKLGNRNWELIREHVTAGLTCSETQIREAMRQYAVYTKHFVEPSGAVSLACLMNNRELFQGKKVVVVASGGNIAIQDYASLVG